MVDMVDICRAARRTGKYLPLFTDTEVNNCSSISKPVDSQRQVVPFFFLKNEGKLARKPEICWQVNSRFYPEFE